MDILVVDEKSSERHSLGSALHAAGHRVVEASNAGEALAIVRERGFDLVVCDARLPDIQRLMDVQSHNGAAPAPEVVVVGGGQAEAAPATATATMELPPQLARLQGEEGKTRPAVPPVRGNGPPEIVGRSPAVRRFLEHLETVARSDAPVLIRGESGTGKELVARQLHERSTRAGGPFVAVNCAAFPEALLEAELFGHERGAFTGAVRKRDGRFHAAHGGTLFLDEVAELPHHAQAKLLRVLEEGAFEPLGTNRTVRVDVRLVSATHRNLKDRIDRALFRSDLYFRLKVLQLDLPPLREREGDLPILVEHFLQRYAPAGKAVAVSDRALYALERYPFPGNVRELEHALHHAVVLARGETIELEHLPEEVATCAPAETAPAQAQGSAAGPDVIIRAGEPTVEPLAEAVRRFERGYLIRALQAHGGRKARTAESLGISRKNLWEKLRKHAISAYDLSR